MNYGVLFESEKQKSKTIFTEGESWSEITLDKTQLTNIDSTYSELFGQSYPTKEDVGAEKIKFISLKKYQLFCRITTLITNKNQPRLIIKRSKNQRN